MSTKESKVVEPPESRTRQASPGPWRVEENDEHRHAIQKGLLRTAAIRAGHGTVAILSGDLNEDEARPNAHLIAAAPDLYAALEAFMGDFAEIEHVHMASQPCPTCASARAALAKARGEA